MSVAIKKLILMLSTKKGRKTLFNIVLAISAPIIGLMVLTATLNNSIAEHNNHTINVLFHDAPLGEDMPEELEENFRLLKSLFDRVDAKINSFTNVEGRFDNVLIKSLLLQSILINENVLENINTDEYLALFYTQINKEVQIESDEIVNDEFKIITVTKPIKETQTLINKVGIFFNIDLKEDEESFYEIYYMALIGRSDDFDNAPPISIILEDAYIHSENKPYVGGSFESPTIDNWQNYVTSEFGPRPPITLEDGTKTGDYHYGIDLGLVLGTPLYAVNDGEVIASVHSSGGYGFYVLLDHGDGIFTLYAHLSKILVEKNQVVTKGELIGEVGSTGNSTGPHLHLEIIQNRKRINPRVMLPKNERRQK